MLTPESIGPERAAALEEIWANVKKNGAHLQACGDHDFTIDLTPEKPLGKRWRCTRCGGEVSSLAKGWYDEGREQERAHPRAAP